MTPLAKVIMSGTHVPSARPRTTCRAGRSRRSPQSMTSRIAVLGADVRDALDVAARRQVHAAGADHRLAEERGHAVRADPAISASSASSESYGTGDPRDQRAPARRVGLDAAERRAEAVRAVVAVRAADQMDALGLASRAKWRRASLAAVSIESPPPLVRKIRASGIGARSASRSAQLVGRAVADVAERRYASRRFICAATASATSARPWPMFAYQSDAVASR